MDQQHDWPRVASGPVADPVAMQDDLVLAWQQIGQIASLPPMNCTLVACRGDVEPPWGRAFEPESGSGPA
jgi:hypothetical protein